MKVKGKWQEVTKMMDRFLQQQIDGMKIGEFIVETKDTGKKFLIVRLK